MDKKQPKARILALYLPQFHPIPENEGLFCWKNVPDDFFNGEDWYDEAIKIFKTAKPMMDFMNAVIDDYE